MTQKNFTASDLTRNTGEILHAASIAPITLTNHGKPRHVIMSVEEFERLKNAGNTQLAFRSDEMPQELHEELMTGIDQVLDETT